MSLSPALTVKRLLRRLSEGPLYRFANWPNPKVPMVAAGVYTVWNAGRFLYVGMSGRGWSADHIDRLRQSGQKKGLIRRIASHANGRRAGDQFCSYVGDRLVVPDLTTAHLKNIGTAELSLDAVTRR